MYISDILSLFERENLSYTILLGHSYGGPVAGGLTDTIPTKISALIYLVAVVPVYGKSVLNLQFDDRHKSLLAQAIGHNGNPPATYITLWDFDKD